MIAIRPYRDEDRAATASLCLASWRSTGLTVALEPDEAELYAANYERIKRELAAGWDGFEPAIRSKSIPSWVRSPKSGLPSLKGLGWLAAGGALDSLPGALPMSR